VHTRYHLLHVVEAVVRADDQHPFLAQRGERRACGQVNVEAEAGFERRLRAWKSCFGRGDLQWHEHPVVEALSVEGGGDGCGLEQPARSASHGAPGAGQVSS